MRKLKTWELGRQSVEDFKNTNKTPVVVILDNIRSGHNVGSVFRTSDAFRIEKIYLCGHSCTPPHPEIYKTALGAEDTIPYEKHENILDCLKSLKGENYILIGIEQTDSSTPLHTYPINNKSKYAIILGNEVNGVQHEALDMCDVILEIPQEGTKHSLNISVAAGIVMWEFFKGLR